MTDKRNEDFEAFKKAWSDYPSQDNEGYQPDRGGFKAGWFAALRYERVAKPAVAKPAVKIFGGDGESPPKYPRVHSTWEIGPHAVDYNGLMWRLEYEGMILLLLTPRYGWFGRLKGFTAFVAKPKKLRPLPIDPALSAELPPEE